MAAGLLNLRIITPERVVFEGDVQEVSGTAIHGEEQLGGAFAILPNHEPLITALAIDTLHFKTEGTDHIAAVIGGLLEVGENKVTVLTDVAEMDSEIDVARAEDAKKRAEAEKTQKTDKLDTQLAEMAMSKAIARLKAAELSQRRRNRNNPH